LYLRPSGWALLLPPGFGLAECPSLSARQGELSRKIR
jgi:hypothetical protein